MKNKPKTNVYKEYNHLDIEKKWQKKWSSSKIYKSIESGAKKKFYVLDMFPYPSGEGLHVGHPKGFIATDIISRMKRMQGYNVLHPMGFDAFGLPAENYAIKMKTNPSIQTAKNVKRYKKQLEIIGLDYDWSREVNTTDPAYYKWTQWIFLQMFKKGLAYESHEPINWCPSCKTGLANEDVEDGKCERCGTVVEKKPMRQWVLRITDYAERLLKDLETKDKNGNPLLKWPNSIVELQKNWIGKSEGALIKFDIKAGNQEKEIEVFTTRPDTLFGVTYVVLAPEHKLVGELLSSGKISNTKDVEEYILSAKKETEIERTDTKKEKTGVELRGVFAINPANKEKVPVWISDYVLADYGTGAVMAVPAHDERDFAFAKKFGLPVKEVVVYHNVGTGVDAPRSGVETLDRRIVDAIIEDDDGNFLLMKENNNGIEHIHLIGSGTDGESDEVAVAREIIEESGYTDFDIKYRLHAGGACHAFRHAKNKNQKTFGYSFYVKLKNKKQVKSEVDAGKHQLVWMKKNEVSNSITWPHHKYIWDMFINGPAAYVDNGILINSDKFNGKNSDDIKKEITDFVGGKWVTKYKLRDWVFSRQRYWGEPIPVVHCEKCGVVPVPEKELPVKLPKVKSYEPTGTGESPLADISKWVNTKCPRCKGKAKRETNTMPQWAGSSWYYLRYMDPKNKSKFADPKKEKYWSPVDFYVGGAEHATRHLIYARFWHKFLFDIGVVSTIEPFIKLQHVGLIMGADGRKMSKRFGNVVNPDDVVNTYGADTLRLYEMFMGPFDQQIAWSTESIVGVRRFLERIWKLRFNVDEKYKGDIDNRLNSLIHKAVKKVTDDIGSMAFNTAISHLMITVNEIDKLQKADVKIDKKSFETLLKILAPFAPHICEELWYSLGNKKSINISSWPTYEDKYLIDDNVTIAVQVNGKMRGTFESKRDEKEEILKSKALALESVVKWLEGREPKKIIVIKNKLISIVV